MQYFILLPNDSDSDLMFSSNILGEKSFKNFWTDDGFKVLKKLIISGDEELLQKITIKDSNGKLHTIEEFLTIIKKLNIIQ
jgi:hypothetical protein